MCVGNGAEKLHGSIRKVFRRVEDPVEAEIGNADDGQGDIARSGRESAHEPLQILARLEPSNGQNERAFEPVMCAQIRRRLEWVETFVVHRIRGHPNPLFRKPVGLEDGLLGKCRNREHGRSALGRAAYEAHRALRERSFEQLPMRLEKNIVNGHDFGDEGDWGRDVLRVKKVEAVDELERRDDEGKPHSRRLREHPMMSRPPHVQQPFGCARLKAIDLELVGGVD